ncbi:hypothetical protein PDJAM_G00132750 [Pangasius djambal]|uniref:Uncharacterized protein n=1 Tax=Pangasius djambal TaxID=1691987 RepID=A0ACC5ZBZ2_9TELE|nr:hypothetical protein [Pangasius djambal]
MLFLDFSSAFNTIIPQQLIQKLDRLGINTSLCNWLLDFLTGRPQAVRFGNNISRTITLNTGAPQGCVLSPQLFTLLTHDCTPMYSTNLFIKFADDTAVVGLIRNNDETNYRNEVQQLAIWCTNNNLSLNIEKTKEIVVDFRRAHTQHPPLIINSAAVERYPKMFAGSLLDYVGSQAQYLHTLLAMTQTNKLESQQHAHRLHWAEMALEALCNVIKNNPGSETECIGHFKLLFSLLRVHGAGKVQQLVLEVVNTVTSNQECVSNIAESLVLANLLLLLHSLPSSRQLVLETLYALTSNTKIVKEAMTKGALIYLLDLFCNSTHPQVRTQTAELFSKMSSDKLVGPKVRLILMRFLPGVFMDAMRDNAEAAVHIFEGTHENPELIWNDTSREAVSTTVREMMLEHFKQQKDNPDVNWKLPEDFTIPYAAGQGELEVGGVFLRIFIAQPGWVLRKPRDFLVSLLETLTELLEKHHPNGEALETVTTAAVCLFSTQTQLADQVPPLGHLPRILAALNHKDNAVPKSSIRLIHVLSENELCVRSMAALETIGPLMCGMKVRADMAGLACEALNRMFQREQTDLVAQALRVELVPYLLKLLEGVGLETLDNPSATKAQIVKALKSMTRSLQYGEQNQVS